MTQPVQPEALRLAAWLNEGAWHNITLGDVNAAGRELRHQHARIAELEAEARIREAELGLLDSKLAQLRESRKHLHDALEDIASGEILRSHCIGPHCTEEVGVATADEMASRAAGALDWEKRVAIEAAHGIGDPA